MHILDFVTIIIFALGIICAGLAFSRRSKNIKSFFFAGGAAPWAMSGLSLFMGFFSAGTFIVWGSIAYLYGWVAVTIQWTMAMAGLLVGLLIAPRWNRTRSLTVADYITKRLGKRTQQIYTYLFLFVSLFTSGAFLYPVAKIIEVSTGLPLNLSIIILGLFCILYTSLGGLWAVMSTDVLQFVILMSAVIIVLPMSIDHIGGWDSFVTLLPKTAEDFVNEEFSWVFMIAFALYNTIFLGGNWAYVQRYTSVKGEKNARYVAFLFCGLYLLCSVLWMLPPMLYRDVDPGLGIRESEGAFLLMCKTVLPAGLLGLMLGGMIFATASSFNAVLNITSGVITNDIYRRFNHNASEKKLMTVARLSTLTIGLLTIVVAMLIPLMGGIVNVVISIAALTGVPLYLPVIWTLFSKFQTSFSVVFSTIFSLTVNLVLKFMLPLTALGSLSRASEMAVGVSVPFFCMLAFEGYFRIKGQKVADHSFPADKKASGTETVEVEESETRDDNRFSRRVVGYGIGTTGLIIMLLGFTADFGRMIICGVAALLLLSGGLIVVLSRK